MIKITEAITTALTEGVYQYHIATVGQHGEVEIEEMVLTRSGAKKFLDNEVPTSFKGMMIEYGESNE